jgi:hypothetical protein
VLEWNQDGEYKYTYMCMCVFKSLFIVSPSMHVIVCVYLMVELCIYLSVACGWVSDLKVYFCLAD